MRQSILILTLLGVAASGSQSETRQVPSFEYPTIQSAIDASSNDDVVEVLPVKLTGAGNVNISFLGRDIVVRGIAGRGATVIDGGGSERAFVFQNGETSAARVENLTITNCSGGDGGAVLIDGASPTFDMVTFSNCVSSGRGGAIFARSDVTLQGCTFTQCEAAGGGGAVYSTAVPSFTSCLFQLCGALGHGGAVWIESDALATVTFSGCTFVSNGVVSRPAGGAVAATGSTGQLTVVLAACTLLDNAGTSGGAVYASGARVNASTCVFDQSVASVDGGALFYDGPNAAGTINRCSITRSSAPPQKGAVAAIGVGVGAVQLSNTIIWRGARGTSVSCTAGAITLSCCDLHGHIGDQNYPPCVAGENGQNGNFEANPIFCSPDNRDFTLAANSPCLDADGCVDIVGAFGEGCAAIPVAGASWGEIKAHYR